MEIFFFFKKVINITSVKIKQTFTIIPECDFSTNNFPDNR